MAATKFSDYLGLKHYKNAKKLKHFNHLGLAQRPQSFGTYHATSMEHTFFSRWPEFTVGDIVWLCSKTLRPISQS